MNDHFELTSEIMFFYKIGTDYIFTNKALLKKFLLGSLLSVLSFVVDALFD